MVACQARYLGPYVQYCVVVLGYVGLPDARSENDEHEHRSRLMRTREIRRERSSPAARGGGVLVLPRPQAS